MSLASEFESQENEEMYNLSELLCTWMWRYATA